MIVEQSQRKDEVLLLRAFKEWKRLEYQLVLEGLKKYSQTLERNQSLTSSTSSYRGFMPRINEKRFYK